MCRSALHLRWLVSLMKLLHLHWFCAFCVSSFATADTCREHDVDMLLHAKPKLFKLHPSVAAGDKSLQIMLMYFMFIAC